MKNKRAVAVIRNTMKDKRLKECGRSIKGKTSLSK